MDFWEKSYVVVCLVLFLIFGFVSTSNAQHTLILAIDVSGSVDDEEMQIQMDGYANSLQFFPYLEDHYIEVLLFSDYTVQAVDGSLSEVRAWFENWDQETVNDARKDTTVQSTSREGQEFYSQVQNGSTCVHTVFEHIYDNWNKYPGVVTVDISGDGNENCVPSQRVRELTQALAENGAIINSLVIREESRDMTFDQTLHFYQTYVTTGQTFVAQTWMDVEETLYNKISLEISHIWGLQPYQDVVYY